MKQGTINNDIILKYDSDNNNLVVSSSAATKKSVADLSGRVDEIDSKISVVDDRVTNIYDEIFLKLNDFNDEININKEIVNKLFAHIEWIERISIIVVPLIIFNTFYIMFMLMKKG
jgi:hypothetical protein|nr:MAG TPA: hypothetical protein [Caudoviricetes sp.]